MPRESIHGIVSRVCCCRLLQFGVSLHGRRLGMRAQLVQAGNSLLLGSGIRRLYLRVRRGQRMIRTASANATKHCPIPVPSLTPTVEWELILEISLSIEFNLICAPNPAKRETTYFQHKPRCLFRQPSAGSAILARKPNWACPSRLAVALHDAEVVEDEGTVIGKRGLEH